MAPKAKAKDFKPTHRALRPIKHDGVLYGVDELLQLDDEQAAELGSTAVSPYTVPVEAMTSAELADAAKDAAKREAEAKKAAGASDGVTA